MGTETSFSFQEKNIKIVKTKAVWIVGLSNKKWSRKQKVSICVNWDDGFSQLKKIKA